MGWITVAVLAVAGLVIYRYRQNGQGSRTAGADGNPAGYTGFVDHPYSTTGPEGETTGSEGNDDAGSAGGYDYDWDDD